MKELCDELMECPTWVSLTVPAVLASLRQFIFELRPGDEDLGRLLKEPSERLSSARFASSNKLHHLRLSVRSPLFWVSSNPDHSPRPCSVPDARTHCGREPFPHLLPSRTVAPRENYVGPPF